VFSARCAHIAMASAEAPRSARVHEKSAQSTKLLASLSMPSMQRARVVSGCDSVGTPQAPRTRQSGSWQSTWPSPSLSRRSVQSAGVFSTHAVT
jgi:hypothetical protein